MYFQPPYIYDGLYQDEADASVWAHHRRNPFAVERLPVHIQNAVLAKFRDIRTAPDGLTAASLRVELYELIITHFKAELAAVRKVEGEG